MDLSKVFHKLNHSILISKLGAHGLKETHFLSWKVTYMIGNSGFVLITILVLGKINCRSSARFNTWKKKKITDKNVK